MIDAKFLQPANRPAPPERRHGPSSTPASGCATRRVSAQRTPARNATPGRARFPATRRPARATTNSSMPVAAVHRCGDKPARPFPAHDPDRYARCCGHRSRRAKVVCAPATSRADAAAPRAHASRRRAIPPPARCRPAANCRAGHRNRSSTTTSPGLVPAACRPTRTPVASRPADRAPESAHPPAPTQRPARAGAPESQHRPGPTHPAASTCRMSRPGSCRATGRTAARAALAWHGGRAPRPRPFARTGARSKCGTPDRAPARAPGSDNWCRTT